MDLLLRWPAAKQADATAETAWGIATRLAIQDVIVMTPECSGRQPPGVVRCVHMSNDLFISSVSSGY